MNYSVSNKEKTRKALVINCSGDYWYNYGIGAIYTVYEPDAGEKEVASAGGFGTFLLSDVYLIPTFTEVAQAIEDGKDILVFDKDSFSFKVCDGISIEFGRVYKIVEDEPAPDSGIQPSIFDVDSLVNLHNGEVYKVVLWSPNDYVCIYTHNGVHVVHQSEMNNKKKWKVNYK